MLDNQSSGGVLPPNYEVYQDLRRKYPAAKNGDVSVMLQGEIPFVDTALFANIDEATISKAAMKTNDAVGPSGFDALGWDISWFHGIVVMAEEISVLPFR